MTKMIDTRYKYTSAQIDAINTIDDHLQIIACAGSGKIQVISERIVNILRCKKSIQPKNIVAFTYTEKVAVELKSRVLRLAHSQLGNIEGIADMYIGTIHGWCLRILQDNILEYQKFSILDEVCLKLFVDRCFNDIGMRNFNMKIYTDTGFFITLMTIIRESELVAPLPENIIEALNLYEKTLIDHCYDYTMIQTKVLEHLKENIPFRDMISSRIKYLIVDKYQDVNPIQERIIETLFNFGLNICV